MPDAGDWTKRLSSYLAATRPKVNVIDEEVSARAEVRMRDIQKKKTAAREL